LEAFTPVAVVQRLRNSYKLNKAKKIALQGISPAVAAYRVALRGIPPAIAAYRRIVLPTKLSRCSVLRIHFGCGEIEDSRFLNVDSRPFRHVDYITRSPLMPALPARSADLIYACHVFEHISYHAHRKVLRRWHEILKPRGQLLLSVPDFDKVVGLYCSGMRGFKWTQNVLMGGQEYSGNNHLAIFTRDTLSKLLADWGFTNIREWHAAEEDCWPKDWSWDESLSLNLRADKPG
jgi:predicted SAM-dependent methyltransferase